MPTVEFVPSIRDSETVTCRVCSSGQFPRNGKCLRCGSALKLEYLSLKFSTQLDPPTGQDQKQLASTIGVLLRSLRKRRGMTQSQLALRGSVARTYLSKAECGHVTVPLSKFLPIARALGLTAVILRFDIAAPLARRRSPDRR